MKNVKAVMKNDDVVMGVRTRKVRVIDSESEDDSDASHTFDQSEWTLCDESTEIPLRINFIPGGRPAGPQVPSSVVEPLDFCKLFFTDELVDQAVADVNRYAARKLEETALSSRSIWHTWYNVTNAEFLAFVAVIVNTGTITAPNLKEYWAKDPTSHISFFPNTFSRERFTQIFSTLHAER